jgi:riboflavin kinase/FMN adenylyltransferase
VLTFEPHPREHFRPDDPPFRPDLLPAKAACLADAGARFVYALRFDDDFAALSAEAFVDQVLHKGLGAKHLASGPDFAFGHRRGGDVRFLARGAASRGMGLSIVPPGGTGGEAISSTRIRRLAAGWLPGSRGGKAGPALGNSRHGGAWG